MTSPKSDSQPASSALWAVIHPEPLPFQFVMTPDELTFQDWNLPLCAAAPVRRTLYPEGVRVA